MRLDCSVRFQAFSDRNRNGPTFGSQSSTETGKDAAQAPLHYAGTVQVLGGSLDLESLLSNLGYRAYTRGFSG